MADDDETKPPEAAPENPNKASDARPAATKPAVAKEAHDFKEAELSALQRSKFGAVLVCVGCPALLVFLYLWILDRYQIPAPPEQLAQSSEYCSTLALKASAISNVHLAIALVLTLGSLAAGYVAVSVKNGASDSAPFLSRNRNTILALCTILFAPLGLISYRRSDAAVELAAAANEARLEGKQQNAICLAAWSAWVRSRLDSNAIGKAALIEKGRQREDETQQVVLQSADTNAKTVEATKQTLEAVKAVAAAAPLPAAPSSAESPAQQELRKSIEAAARQVTEAQQAADVARRAAKDSKGEDKP